MKLSNERKDTLWRINWSYIKEQAGLAEIVGHWHRRKSDFIFQCHFSLFNNSSQSVLLLTWSLLIKSLTFGQFRLFFNKFLTFKNNQHITTFIIRENNKTISVTKLKYTCLQMLLIVNI